MDTGSRYITDSFYASHSLPKEPRPRRWQTHGITLAALYWRYVNDYLTIARFAENHAMSPELAKRVIRRGRYLTTLSSERNQAPMKVFYVFYHNWETRQSGFWFGEFTITTPLDEVIDYLFYNHDSVNPTTTLTVLEE